MNKISSRKFWVWLIWAMIALASMVPAIRIESTVIEFFGFVSLIYIGGNVAQKWVFKKSEKAEPGES